MTVQDEVVTAVEARGYRNGWTDEQFAVRQIAKLTEELGELNRHARHLGLDDRGWHQHSKWEKALGEAAQIARYAFDEGDWSEAWMVNRNAAIEELADIQVVVFCLADALGVDVVELAREKAQEDIGRGVR